MSSTGLATNSYMYGGNDGNAVGVTDSGNVGTSTIYDHIVNVGRVILRSSAPYQLPDCDAAWVTISNPTGNGNVWIGGVADHSPQPNVGYPLLPGAQITLPVTNSNQISLAPATDGDPVYIVVGATNNIAQITPGDPTALDRTPPTVLSCFPLNGSAVIPINTSIYVVCSEAIDPTSINNTNVTINPFDAGMSIIPDSSNPAKVIVFHTSNLGNFIQYTINVSGLKDLAGNAMVVPFSFNFTTSNTTVADTTPPSVTTSNPLANATGIATSIVPTITFSEAILPGSITTSSIVVVDVTAVANMTGYTLSQSSDEKTVTVHGLVFKNSNQYRIDVYNTPSGTAIKDLAGNLLDNTYSIPFTTVAFSITSTNPSANQTNVPSSVNPTITFSEAVLSSSVTTSSILVLDTTNSNTPLTGYTLSLSSDQKTITIGSLTLAGANKYTIKVLNTPSGTAIKDVAGSFLDNTYQIPFTTATPNVLLYNVAGDTHNIMNVPNYTEVAEYIATSSSQLNGRIPVKYTFILLKVGSPSGSVVFNWGKPNGSGGFNLFKQLKSITASSLGTSDTTITIDDPTNTTAFTTGDIIAVDYTSGTSTDYVNIRVSSVDAFDGSNTSCRKINGTSGVVSVSNTIDVAGTISVKP